MDIVDFDSTVRLEVPCVGQTFPDRETTYTFYREYAKVVGFDVRKSSQKKYKNSDSGCREVGLKLYVCNKEGFWNDVQKSGSEDLLISPLKRRKCGSFRCGCRASMTIKLDFKSEMWTVIQFIHEHNHELTSPTKRHYLKHNREVSVPMSNLIHAMESLGFSNTQISRYIRCESGGYNNSEMTMLDIKNFRRDKREDIKDYDSVLLLEHFQKKKSENSTFFYAYKVDEENRLTHLLWSDPTQQQDYKMFGEAITFDTTFKTNYYHMIFASFCGVNHHRQTVFFGSAFLINETKESFVWLFEQFKLCMDSKVPDVIITDQDRGMKAAVAVAFPNTLHRLCSWHILCKLPIKIGAIANKHHIMREFGKVIWNSKSCYLFDLGWKEWVTKYSLEDNEWLLSIFEMRSQWVPVYVKHVFSAGMKTTQRSEGMNAFLRSRVTQYNTLFEFVVRYEEALRAQREKENYSDHMDRNCHPRLHTDLPLERQASVLFTRTMFYVFQDNLKVALLHGVRKSEKEESSYDIYAYKSENDEDTHQLKVVSEEETPKCSCHFFEFVGMPCAHILAYILMKRYQKLPSFLIKSRWTKGIKDGIKVPIYEDDFIDVKWGKYLELSRQASEFVNQAVGDERKREIFRFHMNQMYLEFAEVEVSLSDDAPPTADANSFEVRSPKRSITMFSKSITKPELIVRNPPFAKTKGSGRGGRPKLGIAKRFKSNFEKAMKKPRTCKKCGLLNAGHDSRNCPSGSMDDCLEDKSSDWSN